jgi:hypothetical protein
MAYDGTRMTVLAYGQGFTLWHYRCGCDGIADVADPAFFEAAAGMVAPGDMLLASARDGGQILYAHHLKGRVRTSSLEPPPCRPAPEQLFGE